MATPDSISASLKQTEECVREAAAPGGLTFSPFLFFVILPFHPSPALPVCFLFKKSAVSPGCKTFFLRLHLSSQIKSLRLCNSASVHVHTCVFSDDLCDTFFKKHLLFASGASSSSAVNPTQTDREDMSSFEEEEEEGLRVINCVKLNVSSAPSSTAHFISCTPVWRTRIHLSGPRRLHPKKNNRVRPSPASSSSLSLYFMLCRHLQTSLAPFVTKTTRQTRA